MFAYVLRDDKEKLHRHGKAADPLSMILLAT